MHCLAYFLQRQPANVPPACRCGCTRWCGAGTARPTPPATPGSPAPWYPSKRTPSFLDALAALRRVLWSQRITAMSAAARDQGKITDALLHTLAYAA